MDQMELLVETRARFGDRPYLLDASQEQPLRALLSNWPLRQITIDDSDHADLKDFIAILGGLLDFPEPAPRSWWTFNDYFGNSSDCGVIRLLSWSRILDHSSTDRLGQFLCHTPVAFQSPPMWERGRTRPYP